MSVLNEDEKQWGYREIQIPTSPDDLGGPFVLGVASIESNTTDRGVACIERLPEPVDWLEESEDVYFQSLRDGKTLKAVRRATDEDYKKYRAPIWIQDPEIPECCGRPMFFVGELADKELCTERPPDAKLWWHDTACFYVFTCSQCLSVRAVGQQY